MGKATEPAKCKACGQPHRGTCADHNALGAISSQVGMPETPGIKKAAARVIRAIEAERPAVEVKRGRGRPATGFDKKAYDRQKAAQRRADKKAAEKGKPE